ncbi:MAG TPA: hypothetical protein VIK10_11065 [Prolixibacteraceae bacterium]
MTNLSKYSQRPDEIDTTKVEINGLFDLIAEPEKQLESIKNAILIRIAKTNEQIFYIGELLYFAKRVCLQEKRSFQEWIENNFDFSYESSKNFMHVHSHCMGFKELALKIPTSVLYKIAAPSTPGEFVEFLNEEVNLEKMTNGSFKILRQKYNEGGLKALEPYKDKIGRGNSLLQQTRLTLSIVSKSLNTLHDLKKKLRLETVLNESPIMSEEAMGIKQELFEAVEEAINIIYSAKEKHEKLVSEIKSEMKRLIR